MLIAVKDYLQRHPLATLSDLGLEFRVPTDVMKDMLGLLQKKGWIDEAALSTACTLGCDRSCSSCPIKSATD